VFGNVGVRGNPQPRTLLVDLLLFILFQLHALQSHRRTEEDREQGIQDRGLMTQDRRQRTEDGGQRTETDNTRVILFSFISQIYI
jgi:hypothetical protein